MAFTVEDDGGSEHGREIVIKHDGKIVFALTFGPVHGGGEHFTALAYPTDEDESETEVHARRWQ